MIALSIDTSIFYADIKSFMKVQTLTVFIANKDVYVELKICISASFDDIWRQNFSVF